MNERYFYTEREGEGENIGGGGVNQLLPLPQLKKLMHHLPGLDKFNFQQPYVSSGDCIITNTCPEQVFNLMVFVEYQLGLINDVKCGQIENRITVLLF